MSYDIFLQAFGDGDVVDGDGDAVLRVVAPLIAERDGGWARLVTADGDGEVSGLERPAHGLTFRRCVGRDIWEVVFEVARAGGFVVVPVGRPTCVPRGISAEGLPEALGEHVVSVGSGADILRVVLAD